ncbi:MULTISPECIES: LSm family protein [Thermococcus]|uniref:Putative snRNP Sm-like protein n=1 Tax=Thermococcus nautili TaxID=195522 RepID=W8PJV0_9EURY|nr:MULTISPECIES: LSm family protein [Thermococcus]AHL22369.1 Small nuclear ribonucleoprotein (snRNP-like protein) [Thermococcus nautili]NJE48372.1 small nuclear ribonucleoprotein [Thermococcus sp. 9N3]CAI1493580.1 Putative snRNP Sm-like protein [Thermococcus nautili]
MAERPLDVIHRSLDKDVLVLLKRGGEFRGRLIGYDIHLNVVLADASLMQDGEEVKKYGKIVIRGDNVLAISPVEIE